MDPFLPDDVTDRLGEALAAAGFRYDAVADLLGPTAHAALSRNETTPALRATTGGSPLETLTRLWPLQAEVDVEAAEQALPGLVDPLCVAGLLERSVGTVRARLDVRPYADEDHDWWVVSDLTPGLDGTATRTGADHVLGISSASSSLAQLTVRRPVDRALDLGTGCGVQGLHLAAHAGHVVATDVNRRALAVTLTNARLNGVAMDVREGSLFDPVRRESFDLVVTNPPFVVSPATGERLVYRDSGFPGDEMVRRVVVGAAAHLAPGGVAQVLANWVHEDGTPWEDRVSSWLEQADEPLDAWVVQREVLDPAQYVELWLRDAGHDRSPDYVARYDAWLRWFADQRISGIGMGWLALRRPSSPSRAAVVRLEDWGYDVEQPLGGEIGDWLDRVDLLAGLDDATLLSRTWRVRPDVRQETLGPPGEPDPEVIVLRQQRGFRRARQADTVEAALVGASDGDLPAGRLLDAIGDLLGTPVEDGAARVRELVAEGFLVAE